MRKNIRSHTQISHETRISSRLNALRQNLSNKSDKNNMRRRSIFSINNKNVNKVSKKLSTQFNLVRVDYFSESRLKQERSTKHFERNIKNLYELLTSKNARNESKEEATLLYALNHKEKKGFENQTDKLIEIIKYILSKKEKNEMDILIIKTYFSKVDKISSLFSSLNSESIFIKLLSQLNFEEYKEDNIICKEGDKGEKLYITLKGGTDVLAQREGKDGICTQFEYIKYLIVLYLYQETGMLSKVIYYNKSIIKLKEACVLTLFMTFRFYKFYKEQDFFLIDSGIKYEEDSICDFINNQNNIKEFIYQKLDYPVEDSIHIFNYTQNIVKELYRFYERKIEDINQHNQTQKEKDINSFFNLEISNYDVEEKPKSHNTYYHPSNFEELMIYGDNIKSKYYTKNKKQKDKIKEEVFNKIFEIKEISKNIIYKSNSKDYLKRLNFDSILKDIRNDYIYKADKTFRLKEEQKSIKYLNYLLVNTINQYQIFGELALNSLNKKRTATIISNDHCYFGVLYKKVYDSHLKVAQIKSRIRNILYFTEGPIFKGISPSVFLNEFFYFLNKTYINKGQNLFLRGDKRKKIYFVEKGEFELGCKVTLKQVGEMMNKLGGISDDKKEKYLCNLFIEFKQVYENKNMNIKICILDKNYIIGLDDMCLDNKHLFDCKCVSTDGADVYEFDYGKYAKALNSFNIILGNNAEYVNKRRESFIKILFEQRNSLVEYEYGKLKEENIRKEKMKEITYAKKFNILKSLMKGVKYNKKQLIDLAEYKKKKKDKPKEENNNLNENKKHDEISSENKFKQFPSMKMVLRDPNNKLKLSEHGSISNSNRTKSLTNFYPKKKSEKNIMVNIEHFKTLNNFSEKSFGKEIKNKRGKINLWKLTKHNPYNYDFTDSNLIFNERNKLLESVDIHVNQTLSVEKRRKRNVIPIITNYKLSLNKKKFLKNINKDKDYKIPSLFKESSKDYSSIKTKIKKENDNLYTDYQKNVYNIFYPRYCKKMLEIKTSENEEDDKNFFNFTENTKTNKDSNVNKEIKKKQKIDKSINVNLTGEKKYLKNKNDINFFNLIDENNNKGFIDCLCFDNWAEKRQFEKNLLSHKIS